MARFYNPWCISTAHCSAKTGSAVNQNGDKNISQGGISTRLKFAEICNYNFITNLLLHKKSKSLSAFGDYGQDRGTFLHRPTLANGRGFWPPCTIRRLAMTIIFLSISAFLAAMMQGKKM